MVERSEPISSPPRGARRGFATHAVRRRSRLAVQSQPWAAQRMGGRAFNSPLTDSWYGGGLGDHAS